MFQVELTEYGIPVEKRAQVTVDVTRPGGSSVTVPASEVAPGIFVATTTAPFSGIYYGRVMAKGVTLRGAPFTREQTATVAVWRGGDNPYEPPRDYGASDWCKVLACLLDEKVLTREVEQQLAKAGINLDRLRQCLKVVCGRQQRIRG